MADLIHNRALRAAEKRAEALVEKLARLLEPILASAGTEAARRFSGAATDHLTAAALEQADRAAVARVADAHGDDGLADLGRGVVLHASAVAPNSTMVALVPRRTEAEAIAQGGEPDVMHVTLAYLGQYDGDLSTVAGCLAQVAAGHAPLAGQVGGVGHFADNGKGHPSILLPSVPGLVELRVAVTEALVKAGMDYGRDHGYLPHATVRYDPDPSVPDAEAIGTPLHFDSLWVVRGDVERVELPLTGVRPLTAAGDVDPGWTAPGVDEVFDMAAFVAAIRAKTDPVRQAAIESMMGAVLGNVGIDFDVANPFTARVLAQAGQHVTSIADTTRVEIQRIIDSSYQNGLSIPHTAKAIRLGMKEAAPARARTIARTELVGAVNGGSLAAAQIVGSATATEYVKVWMTAPGARHPRHENYPDLDGQTVSLDDYFDVGGSTMQFPGDPDGDPGEVINCRCTMSYEDQSGNEVDESVDTGDE